MAEHTSSKTWPGEPIGLWPGRQPKVRNERRTDAERIDAIWEGIRIDHTISRSEGPRLVDFVERSWEPHQRWRGLLLVGPARSGRSWMISRWLPEDYSHKKIVVAQMPTDVSGDRILRAILDAGSSHPSSLVSHPMRLAALRRMGESKAVVFDGCDHLARLRKPQLLQLLARVKSYAEQRCVPVILVANPRLLELIAADEDWEMRFEALHLPRWRVDRDFLDLLTDWEDQLPLRETSHLAERELALHLYSICDGSIGRLSEVLRKAALEAIENCDERITIELLDKMGFTPPATFRQFLF